MTMAFRESAKITRNTNLMFQPSNPRGQIYCSEVACSQLSYLLLGINCLLYRQFLLQGCAPLNRTDRQTDKNIDGRMDCSINLVLEGFDVMFEFILKISSETLLRNLEKQIQDYWIISFVQDVLRTSAAL